MKLKPWWDTPTARQYGTKGLATILIGRRIAYTGFNRPDNDSWTGN